MAGLISTLKGMVDPVFLHVLMKGQKRMGVQAALSVHFNIALLDTLRTPDVTGKTEVTLF